MCDYCSEAEALSEREDDNCEFDYDDWDGYSGAPWNDYDYYLRRPVYVGRKSKLSKKIEDKKKSAEATKVGNECKCPICGRNFVKKSYQQKFCSDKCRIKYHNKRKIYV